MNKGFNLITVIIITIVTSVVVAFTTGIIMDNKYKSNSGLTYSEVMNDEDLAEFISIYSTIISEYYDQVDTTGMINSAIDAIKDYDGEDKNEMLDNAVEAMLSFLGDDYTTFLDDTDSEILNDQLDSSYEGIGVTIQGNEIITVLEDSPAKKAGLLPGDIIYQIDDQLIDEENQVLISYFIKESGNEYVNLTISREGINTTYKIKKETLDGSVQANIIKDSNIGYINVDVFSEEVGSTFEKNLESLESQGIESLIIDLRYNTGGYLNGAIELASLFLEKGQTIFSLENKEGNEYTKDTTTASRDYEIIILMNEESASASEILAAALRDNLGSKIVGVTSFGKGKVQQTLSTENGLVAKYTSAKWYTPNNICIDEIGLEPDYYVELEYEYDEAGEITGVTDAQFEKAVELLTK